MKKSLLLFFLLALFAGQHLHAQFYAEDWTPLQRGKQYYYDDDMYTFWCVAVPSLRGVMTVYTDHPETCNAPLVVSFGSTREDCGRFTTFGFWRWGGAGSEVPFMDYCEYFGYSRDIWEYRALHVMLKHCRGGVRFEIDPRTNAIDAEAFFGTLSLEQVQIKLGYWNGEAPIIGEGAFRDCPDLKYVSFDTHIGSIHQDVFLGCPSLEIIRFGGDITDPNNMRHMFHTNWDCTGSYYYPNLKAIVVPDNYRNLFPNFETEFADKVCRAVKEGWTKIIPESRFNSPKPQSVTINPSAITLPFGASHQMTANISPSNVYSKNIIWSSTDTAVATVSPTGLVTVKNSGAAYITATLEMDNRYWGTCLVTAPPTDYVHLKTLSVAGHPFPGGFNVNTLSYSLTVPFSTSSINISAEANNYPGVTVTGAGTKTLPVGDTILPVTVNSGSTSHANRTYTIRIHRKSNDATLKSLTAGGNTLPPDNPAISIAVSHAVTSIAVAAEATHSLASVSVSGTNSLNVGDNTVTVTVTAEDGNTATYTITVHRKSIDATLKSFTLNNGDIPFGFNPAAQDYEISVSNSVTGIAVAAVANDSLATVSGDTGNKTLKVGDNIITATVTPEDGQPETYTIVIHRKSTDATLQSLTVNGQSVSSSFAPAHLNYQIAVSNSVSVIALEAVATYPLAIVVTGASNKTLNVGDNLFSVTVIPEEGQPKTYTVIVHRKSADDRLQSLTMSSTFNGSNISMEYNPEKLTYTTTVPDSVKNITLHAKANHSAAFVTGHTGIQSLRPGRNIFHITVTSEDGTVKTHPVIITVVGNVII